MPKIAEEVKKMIKSGKIDIEKLSSMSSSDRREFFKKVMGDSSARQVNSLFEEKLLLKNQRKGLVNWAKQITGLKPEAKRDLVDRIMKMDKILSPENEKAFLQELASKRLGTDISISEAKKITELSNNIRKLESFTSDSGRIKYGKSKLDLTDYVNSLNPKKANIATNVLNLPRTVMATLDLSAPLNQGWGMLSRKQFYTSFKKMFSYAKSDNAFRELQADILTRPNYKVAKKAGLRLSDIGDTLQNREEVFMSNLVDKIPGVKGSQRAYTGFLNKLRMDTFDDLINKARLAGEDVSLGSKSVEDIANVVNNFTGGAKSFLGEGSTQAVNGVLFSPRKVSSALNILNPVNYLNPNISKTARKEALRNLIGSTAITAGVLKLADIAGGDAIEIEADPRSSDFGKIKVGNTRIDISGGNANYATLIARLLSQRTKSTNTGVISKLGEGYGSKNGFDVATGFARNKLAPVASLVVDSIAGENAIGEKKTIPESVKDRFKPMFINSVLELSKDKESGSEFTKAFIATAALLGAGVNTYSISENWEDSDSKELSQLKEYIGKEKFNEANEKYNEIIKTEINATKKTEEYKAKTAEEKLKDISDIKDEAKKDVFREYNFKAKKSLPKKK